MFRRGLTNSFRATRGLVEELTYNLCGAEEEDLLHFLRDCRVVKECWFVSVSKVIERRLFELNGASGCLK